MIEKPEKKIIEHANGGKGRIILQPIAGPDILKDKCRVYVKATLEKGCSMGVHQHNLKSREIISISEMGLPLRHIELSASSLSLKGDGPSPAAGKAQLYPSHPAVSASCTSCTGPSHPSAF